MSDHLAPHLTNRTTVGLYGSPGSRPNPQWIMVDTSVPEDQRYWPGQPLGVAAEEQRLEENLRNGYDRVATQDGFVLLTRRT